MKRVDTLGSVVSTRKLSAWGISDKAVLDREYAVETAKHFKDSLDLLNDLLDYGAKTWSHAHL